MLFPLLSPPVTLIDATWLPGSPRISFSSPTATNFDLASGIGISKHLFRTGGSIWGCTALIIASFWLPYEKTVCNLRRHGCNYLCSVERPLPPLSMATQRLPTRVGGSTLNEHICHRNVTVQTPWGSKDGLIMNPDALGPLSSMQNTHNAEGAPRLAISATCWIYARRCATFRERRSIFSMRQR